MVCQILALIKYPLLHTHTSQAAYMLSFQLISGEDTNDLNSCSGL